MSSVEARLTELGITLPTPAAPVANYVPFVRTGDLVVISGQWPMQDGKLALAARALSATRALLRFASRSASRSGSRRPSSLFLPSLLPSSSSHLVILGVRSSG